MTQTAQTREALVEVIAKTLCMTATDTHEGWEHYKPEAIEVLAALEAAGVRLVPVDEKPGQGWLHEAVKDASLRASENSGRVPPQLLYAPILWAMQDALNASPYKDKANG